ncbi:MAG: mechanosensitive ion channel family protein [DPANN group archaeon]|nr:mechanosensitive ion channel family protein [DPANN group archaeon]
MNITTFSYTVGALGYSYDIGNLLTTIASVIIIMLVAYFMARILKPIFRKLDKKIIWFNFSKTFHDFFEDLVVYITYLSGVYASFILIGIENPFKSKIYQFAILYFIAKITINYLVKIVRKFDRKVFRMDFSENTYSILETIIRSSIYIIVIIIALSIMGFSEIITTLITGAGIASIAVGFAAKDVVSNMISGFMIIIDKPFKIGDIVEIQNQIGTIDDIALRKTVIRLFDNKFVIIPNSMITTDLVINYTKESIRRISVPVGIAYGSDVEKAIKSIIKEVNKVDGVISEKKPTEILVKAYGAYSVDLEVRCWVDLKKDIINIQNDVTKNIKTALDKAKIEIPYPHTVMINRKK